MSDGASGDPERVAEGFLGGDLVGGSVYLLKGKYLLDREDVLEGVACNASAKRRVVLLSFTSLPNCPVGSLEVLDASAIRDEGLKVVAGRLMDGLSSGGAVIVDSGELLLGTLGNEREYLNLIYTLRRVSRAGRGALVLASSGGPEEALVDYSMEVGPALVGGRRFRILKVHSPYSPSSRDQFLLSSDRRIVRPSSYVGRGQLDLGELYPIVSSLKSGSSLEIYLEDGVPEYVAEGLVEGVISALKEVGIQASLYPGGSKEIGVEAGDLLVLGRPEESLGMKIYVGCPACPHGRSDYLARVASVGGVVVVFFERPWSAAYYLDGPSLRRLD